MIDGKFLHGRAMGEFHPAGLKDGSSKWNRRVEIVIQGRGPAAQKAHSRLKILWGNIMADENEVEEKKSSIVPMILVGDCMHSIRCWWYFFCCRRI